MRMEPPRRLGDERGIALVVALAAVVVLAVAVTALISYTTSNQSSSALSQAEQSASHIAEGGLQTAYSILNSGSVTDATALGCAGTGGTGQSNCSSFKSGWPLCVPVQSQSGCTSGGAGTATVYGFYGGSASTGYSYGGRSAGKSQWVIVSVGYVRGGHGSQIVNSTLVATAQVSQGSGNPASYWNHFFSTAPLQPNVCSLTIDGNQTAVDVPVYTVGNLCFSGNDPTISQTGQPIDLEVGGRIVFGGNHPTIGSSGTKINQGVVVLGCSGAFADATTSCSGGTCSSAKYPNVCVGATWPYYVAATGSYVANSAPDVTAQEQANIYTSADPGPKHPCASGGLPASTFDNDTTQNNSVPAVFDLTPSTSYTCVSQNGSSVGQLSWNASTGKLTINGTIFIDGSMKATHSAQYTGSATIYVAGSFSMAGTNQVAICSVKTGSNCDFNNWQGTTNNKDMLTIAALGSSGTTIDMTGANQAQFQGSFFCQPGASVSFNGNQVAFQGPITCGSFTWGNQPQVKPLPAIKNMPPGAPLPPNSTATIGSLVYQ